MSFWGRTLYSQLFITPPKPTQSFTSKTVIVTGSNTGLGLEAARHFVHLDAATVILAVRDTTKGEAAKKYIDAAEKVTDKDRVKVWKLDMSSYASVTEFAKRCDTELERLDVLAANAGINTTSWNITEGHENTITVNVISTFLLSLLLLPKLKATALKYGHKTHVAITSSEVHEVAAFKEREAPNIFAELTKNKASAGQDRYMTSKLLEVLVIREIVASQLGANPAEYPVIWNFSNPGLCYSEIVRDGRRFLWPFIWALARRTDVGSRVLVYAAGEAGPESQGMYISDSKVKEPGHWVKTDEGVLTARRVWDELQVILEDIVPGVTKKF